MSQRQSVSHSLRFEDSFRSDQGQVWERIRDMQERAEFHSPTGAMRDVYEGRNDALKAAGECFIRLDGQRGLIALTPEGTIGLDYVSRAEVYAVAHKRIVQSYLFDAIWLERNERESDVGPRDESSLMAREGIIGRAEEECKQASVAGSDENGPETATIVAKNLSPEARVGEFLERLRTCGLRAYPSPGRGLDVRIQAKSGFGNALDLDGEILYFGAFSGNAAI